MYLNTGIPGINIESIPGCYGFNAPWILTVRNRSCYTWFQKRETAFSQRSLTRSGRFSPGPSLQEPDFTEIFRGESTEG